jgi:hypothetical protein
MQENKQEVLWKSAAARTRQTQETKHTDSRCKQRFHDSDKPSGYCHSTKVSECYPLVPPRLSALFDMDPFGRALGVVEPLESALIIMLLLV